jgi:hypothetical protein
MRTTLINKKERRASYLIRNARLSIIVDRAVSGTNATRILRSEERAAVTSPAERVVINIIIVIIGRALDHHAPEARRRRISITVVVEGEVLRVVSEVGGTRGAEAPAGPKGVLQRIIIIKAVSGMREMAGGIAVVETGTTVIADHPLLNLLLLIVGVVAGHHLRRLRGIEREGVKGTKIVGTTKEVGAARPILTSTRISSDDRLLSILILEQV